MAFDREAKRAEMVAKAANAKPIVTGERAQTQAVVTFTADGKAVKYPVVLSGEKFWGYAQFRSIRLVEVRCAWQPVDEDNRAPKRNKPAVKCVLTVQATINVFREKIGEIKEDGTLDPLDAYVLDAEVFTDEKNGWLTRPHTINGRQFDANVVDISRLSQILGEDHGFGITKHVDAGEKPDGSKGRPWLYVARAPMVNNPKTGEPIFEKRGAPLESFSIGLPPEKDRKGNVIVPPAYDDLEAGFNSLYAGTLQSTESLLEAATGKNEAEKERMRQMQYSLTGFKKFDGRDNETVYSEKEAPFAGLVPGEADWEGGEETFMSRRSTEGMSVQEMLDAKPILGASMRQPAKAGVANGAKSKYDDPDEAK